MKSVDSVDIKAFIDARKMSPYQWLVLGLCFLIVTMDGLDTAVMGFVAPVIMHEWNVSRAAFGPVMSAAMVGLAIGALVAGPASDRVGRKKVLIGSVLCFGLFSLMCAFAESSTQLLVLRFLTGLGLGAAMPNSTTLLSEYVPSRSRSLLLTIMFTGFNFGSGAGGFVAASLIPNFGWRAVFMFGGILPLLSVPLLIWLLPESARLMLVRNLGIARIATTLGRVCGHVFDRDVRFTAPEPVVSAKAPVRMLFADGYALSTLMLWVTYFMGLLIIYLLTGWLPTLIKDAGLPVERAAAITGMFQLGGTVGAIVVGFAMDRMDRNAVIGAAYLLGSLHLCAGNGNTQVNVAPNPRHVRRLFHEWRPDGSQRTRTHLLSNPCPCDRRELDAGVRPPRRHPGVPRRRSIVIPWIQLRDCVLRTRYSSDHCCDRYCHEPPCAPVHHQPRGRRLTLTEQVHTRTRDSSRRSYV